MSAARQATMFGVPAPDAPEAVAPAPVAQELIQLGASLPPPLRFGTSSWAYSGWANLVYGPGASEAALRRSGLRAYARHPLLSAVGVDRTHYAPMSTEEFAACAAQVPEHFRFLAKAHDHCTLARFPRHPRYGARAGERNDRFLDPIYASEAVVGPFASGLGRKAGPLLFQFAPQDLDLLGGPRGFADRIHRFLSALPKGTFYAVEVRNAPLVTPELGDALAAVRAAPGLLAHPFLPDVETQARVFGTARFPALVLRWMLHRAHEHEEAGEAWSPFDQLHEEEPSTRAAIARLAVDAVHRGRPALVIVNNIAEGSAPLSIEKLAAETAEILTQTLPERGRGEATGI